MILPYNETPTVTDPFGATKAFDIPLGLERCQEIHYRALRQAVREGDDTVSIAAGSLGDLRRRARWYGSEVYLLHPDDIQRMFKGVSLRVYQTIAQLYCSRLGLSVGMIYRILTSLASRGHVDTIDAEAIWAICRYLDERRTQETAVVIQQSDETWCLGRLYPEMTIRNRQGRLYRPVVFAIMSGTAPQLLALQVADTVEDPEAPGRALYQAVASQRHPAPTPLGAAGLRWTLPKRVATDEPLSQDCERACQSMGMIMTAEASLPPSLISLMERWAKDFADRMLTTESFLKAFDTYIYRILGNSPIRWHEEQERAFAHLIGYNRDPAWHFPALRWLLPAKPSVISDEGAVSSNGLTYCHEVLKLWPGAPVTVRRSVTAEADAWIYMDDDVVCLAKARELQRKDGTYRPWR